MFKKVGFSALAFSILALSGCCGKKCCSKNECEVVQETTQTTEAAPAVVVEETAVTADSQIK